MNSYMQDRSPILSFFSLHISLSKCGTDYWLIICWGTIDLCCIFQYNQMANTFLSQIMIAEQFFAEWRKLREGIQSFIETSKWNRFQLTFAQTGKFYLCLCPRIPLPCRFPQRIQLFGKIQMEDRNGNSIRETFINNRCRS